jgi:hypothetical protein
MNAAHAFKHSRTGSQHQVIGIGEQDIRAGGVEFLGFHAFDCGLGTDRHKDGRFDFTMQSAEATGAGP